MLLLKVAECQDRALIEDPNAWNVVDRKPPHRRHLDQGILHRWIAPRVPLLHQVEPQHGCQRVGRPVTLAAGLGEVGLDQFDQGSPVHRLVNFCQRDLPLGALLGGGLLAIIKS